MVKVFDAKEASKMVKELRSNFDSDKTRSYEWRKSQLKSLLKLTDYHEQDILRALHSDLSKPEHEAFIQEVTPFYYLFISISISISITTTPVFIDSVFCEIIYFKK